MSVEELARALGLPAATVRDIESGERPMTNPVLFEQTFTRLERAKTERGE